MFNKLLVVAAIAIISVSAYAQCPANMEKSPYGICVVKRAIQQQQANIKDTKTMFIGQQKNNKIMAENNLTAVLSF